MEVAREPSPAQLAGSELLPDPLHIGGSLEKAFSRRVSRLPPETHHNQHHFAPAGLRGWNTEVAAKEPSRKAATTVTAAASQTEDDREGNLPMSVHPTPEAMELLGNGPQSIPVVMLLRASSATTAVGIGQAAIDDDVAARKPGNLQPLHDAMWQSAYPADL